MGEKKSEEIPERWRAQKKTEVVLRLLRGEALDEVSQLRRRTIWRILAHLRQVQKL